MRENCFFNDCCEAFECSGCPLDDFDNVNDVPFYLEKDRSASRKRHHSKVKAKKKSIQNARFLASKAYDRPRLPLRTMRVLKDSQIYKEY